MNAAGPTAERIYDAIKAHVLQGAFRPGARLDPAALAERLDCSVTPVRASLAILVGEGLVETGTGEGFHLPLIDEPTLRDRYAWNADLLALALRRAARERPDAVPRLEPGNAARRAASLFTQIARRSLNLEHAAAIARMNDRLHATRIAESHVLDAVDAELDAIAEAIRGDDAALRPLLVRYHRRRIAASAAILHRLYRMAAPPAE